MSKGKWFPGFLAIAGLGLVSVLFAQELKPVKLPAPDMQGGKPLMQALKERKSSRDFTPNELPPAVLSNLLWAANGINRPSENKRTAPSAMNCQEIEVYVVTASAAYRYDAITQTMQPVAQSDLRALTGKQEFVAVAPVNLVFVADYSKMKGNNEGKAETSAADAAFISENIYLYCASEGLGTVVRGYVDKEPLAKALKLRPEQHIVFAQTVGYPKK
jgi:nitroreductase